MLEGSDVINQLVTPSDRSPPTRRIRLRFRSTLIILTSVGWCHKNRHKWKTFASHSQLITIRFIYQTDIVVLKWLRADKFQFSGQWFAFRFTNCNFINSNGHRARLQPKEEFCQHHVLFLTIMHHLLMLRDMLKWTTHRRTAEETKRERNSRAKECKKSRWHFNQSEWDFVTFSAPALDHVAFSASPL
jgi:hypothetical protein